MEPDVDVAIVGCGPVGAVAGLLTTAAGFLTLVLDARADVFPLPRAIHFDAEIMRTMQRLGLTDALAPYLRQWDRSVFTGADGELLLVHEFPTEWVHGWAPHYLFEQPPFEQVLRQALSDTGARLLTSHAVTSLETHPDGVALHVLDRHGTSMQVTASWVLGADGAASTVRRSLGIALEDKQFDEPWLVVDVRVEDPTGLPTDSHMICDPARPSTVINGPRDLFRWEFMLLPGEDPDTMQEPETVWKLLGPWVTPETAQVVRAAVYRFHALVADRWSVDRVLLVGDAAHQTPPFLGQGMCHGIRDALSLVWRLAALRDSGGDASRLLASWEQERRQHVDEIIDLAVASGRDICILDADLAARRDSEVRARQREAELPPSPFAGLPPLRGSLVLETPGAGALFPQPRVVVEGATRLLDDILRDAPAIVSCSDRPNLLKIELLDADVDRGVLVAVDDEALVSRWMASHGISSALVRPDRYVYATTDHGDTTAIREAWFEAVGRAQVSEGIQ